MPISIGDGMVVFTADIPYCFPAASRTAGFEYENDPLFHANAVVFHRRGMQFDETWEDVLGRA